MSFPLVTVSYDSITAAFFFSLPRDYILLQEPETVPSSPSKLAVSGVHGCAIYVDQINAQGSPPLPQANDRSVGPTTQPKVF